MERVKKVKEIMSGKVVTTYPDQLLPQAAELMVTKKIGSLVVVENDKPVGIITESNFVKTAAKNIDLRNLRVKEVMSKPVVTCAPNLSIIDLVKIMCEKRVRHVPVVEKGKLIGIITAADLAVYGIPVMKGIVTVRA